MTTRIAPLLPGQWLRWNEVLADPDDPDHVMATLLRIEGALDPGALGAAFEAIQRAQPALRTTYHDGPGPEPFQLVHSSLGFSLQHADVRGDADPARAARRLAEALSRQPFDLAHGPPLRALLVCMGERDHLLVVAVPAIAVDGWSVVLLIQDLEQTYRARVSGQKPPAEDYTGQYVALCTERNAPTRSEDSQVARYARWIAGVPRLRLPTDFPRPARASIAGAEVRVELHQDELDALAAGARRQRTSRFSLLFAAFAAVLAARSGQDRFLLCAFVAGRTRPEHGQLYGRFANLIPLPVDLSGAPTPAEVVRRASRTWWDSFDYHTAPIPELAGRMDAATPDGSPPFCDVNLVFLDLGEPTSNGSDEPRIRRERQPTRCARRDLRLFVGPSTGGRFELRVEYRTELYRESTAWELLAAYRAALAEMCSAQREPVATPASVPTTT